MRGRDTKGGTGTPKGVEAANGLCGLGCGIDSRLTVQALGATGPDQKRHSSQSGMPRKIQESAGWLTCVLSPPAARGTKAHSGRLALPKAARAFGTSTMAGQLIPADSNDRTCHQQAVVPVPATDSCAAAEPAPAARGWAARSPGAHAAPAQLPLLHCGQRMVPGHSMLSGGRCDLTRTNVEGRQEPRPCARRARHHRPPAARRTANSLAALDMRCMGRVWAVGGCIPSGGPALSK